MDSASTTYTTAYHGLAAYTKSNDLFGFSERFRAAVDPANCICCADRPIGGIGIVISGVVVAAHSRDCYSRLIIVSKDRHCTHYTSDADFNLSERRISVKSGTYRVPNWDYKYTDLDTVTPEYADLIYCIKEDSLCYTHDESCFVQCAEVAENIDFLAYSEALNYKGTSKYAEGFIYPNKLLAVWYTDKKYSKIANLYAKRYGVYCWHTDTSKRIYDVF